MTYTEQIERGAALLDEALPGWEQAVDTDRLDLMMGTQCVLGQVFGTYGAAVTALGWRTLSEEAQAHGFVLRGEPVQSWGSLTAEWQTFINARKRVLVNA